ncbi:helix-turn-helix domain-containing protein [Yeosuana sp. MJ-SS3]|uniref:Helix-turn-helix domain-containing protein n=1 Tax=Gilvirhabdus luticola TaxID=3079858 RepID=A0ABU3U479_9FLAO|nr:helix-turn-helix domain-containing protein [Yeosuana sp. MJ-SS3]
MKRKKFDISIKYLNIVVLCLSLNNIREFVFDGNHLSDTIIYFYLSFPWHFLVVPMFYAFLIYYLKVNNKIPNYLKFTYSIFIIETSIRIYLIGVSTDLEGIFADYIIIEEMLNAVYAIFIFYRIIRLIFFDKHALETIYKYDNISWIKNILKFGFFLMVLWIFAVIYYSITRNAVVYDPLKVLYSVLIYWLGYKSLIHSKIVNDRIYLRRHIENSEEHINKNLISNFVKDRKSSIAKHKNTFQSIQDYIIAEHRYLDPTFSLEKLSEELNISISQLSKIINTFGSFNFSDYINSLRIEQAKKLLEDRSFDRYTIIAIGLESGFNSKSTFYSAFKKFTSQTPSAYRELNG